MSRLVLVSKSPASPAIRREHALAALAVANGIEVVFIERPIDIRVARGDPLSWIKALAMPPSRPGPWGRQVAPAVVVPGHLGRVAAALSARLIARVLRSVTRPGDVVCAMVPWDWPAVEPLSGVRRIFDCADDWATLIPGRAAHLEAHVRRAASSADEVVVASPKLAMGFAPRKVKLIRNAASTECLATPAIARRHGARAVYVGTLTERIDTGLIDTALNRLPDLSIDLYGTCAYAGRGAQPSAELSLILSRHPGRLTWNGAIDGADVPGVIDAADVGLLPFRAKLARGDIMKIYDYAARGRPIVSTTGVVDPDLGRVPGLVEAQSALEFALSIERALATPFTTLAEARVWAEANSSQARWPAWRDALFGADSAA
jgi:hypothetical protein